jgi:hypothetical protein
VLLLFFRPIDYVVGRKAGFVARNKLQIHDHVMMVPIDQSRESLKKWLILQGVGRWSEPERS